MAGLVVVLACLVFWKFDDGHAKASSEPDIVGEWGFHSFWGIRDYYTEFLCIGSLVRDDPDWVLRMSCQGAGGFIDLRGSLDASKQTMSMSGTLDTGAQLALDGTLDTSPNPSVQARWTFGNVPEANGWMVGARGLAGRGMVTCPRSPPILPHLQPAPRRTPNSADALLIEQFAADFVDDLPCLYLGDVNIDGRVDAVDAQLVLQYTAGLIEHFPPS
jgi:hypothetical protein